MNTPLLYKVSEKLINLKILQKFSIVCCFVENLTTYGGVWFRSEQAFVLGHGTGPLIVTRTDTRIWTGDGSHY